MELLVRYLEGKKFQVECRSHKVIVDQPKSDGGTDKGMDPSELFNAGLASCAAFYAVTFLNRRISNLSGLKVESSWSYAEDPHRVGTISLNVTLPCKISQAERKGVIRTIEQCAVKNTLETPPNITLTLKE